MAKATTTQKKTANKKSPKATKKTTKKTATKKAGSTRGRKLFDGKDQDLVLAKLKAAYSSGASDNQASIMAGISPSALSKYMKANQEFRNVCNELAEIPLMLAHNVQNSLVSQREKKDNVYDEDGKKIKLVPTRDAITASRISLRARDRRYATNQGDTPPPPATNGGLTDERKAEIVEAIHNRNKPDPEAYVAT